MRMVRGRGPLTPFFIILFVLVLGRWLEMRMGWGEHLSLPLAALAGVVLLEATAPSEARRVSAAGWMLNGVAAVAVAGLIYVMA